jgi:hypothetical protein
MVTKCNESMDGWIGNNSLSLGYVSLPSLYDYRTMSISFWMIPSATNWSGARVIYKTGQSDCQSSGLRIIAAAPFMQVSWSSLCLTGGGLPQSIIPGEIAWHHYTIVIDANRDVLSMYIDGALYSRQHNFTTAPSQRSLATTPSVTYFGGSGSTNDNYTDYTSIQFSHLAIYDIALSSSQVRRSFIALNQAIQGSRPIAYYPFTALSLGEAMSSGVGTATGDTSLSTSSLGSDGWPTPESKCASTKVCSDSIPCGDNSDCGSGYCTAGLLPLCASLQGILNFVVLSPMIGKCTPRCENGILDGPETAIDCGGTCMLFLLLLLLLYCARVRLQSGIC